MKIKTRRYYIYYLARAGAFLLWLFPIRFVSNIAAILGRLGFYLLKKERNRTSRNLKTAFTDKQDTDLAKIGMEAFSNIARNFAEYVNFSRINKGNIDLWVETHGLEKIDRALALGKGAIILTAHFGNWELVGAYVLIKGYKGAAITKRIYFYKYNDFLVKLRLLTGIVTIYRDESPKKVLMFLKKNGLIGILADQDIDSIEGIFVDFFGRPTYTPTAPVKIAMASRAPMIPCYMLRNGNRYDFIVEDPIFVEKGRDKEESIRYYTQEWTSILESYIRRYPGQWVWMHDRWKTKPQQKI